jgi:hypothetical protein
MSKRLRGRDGSPQTSPRTVSTFSRPVPGQRGRYANGCCPSCSNAMMFGHLSMSSKSMITKYVSKETRSCSNRPSSRARAGNLGVRRPVLGGAPRSTKMGTIRSPWHYDAGARHPFQSAKLRRPAMLHYALVSCCLPGVTGRSVTLRLLPRSRSARE